LPHTNQFSKFFQ